MPRRPLAGSAHQPPGPDPPELARSPRPHAVPTRGGGRGGVWRRRPRASSAAGMGCRPGTRLPQHRLRAPDGRALSRLPQARQLPGRGCRMPRLAAVTPAVGARLHRAGALGCPPPTRGHVLLGAPRWPAGRAPHTWDHRVIALREPSQTPSAGFTRDRHLPWGRFRRLEKPGELQLPTSRSSRPSSL